MHYSPWPPPGCFGALLEYPRDRQQAALPMVVQHYFSWLVSAYIDMAHPHVNLSNELAVA
jgi:hypothetical protein